MKTRTTVKDIAAKAGVSLSTVHAALNNKPGVSEKTRSYICGIAKELNYHSNTVAASLKRRPYCILALFPQETGENRYYYRDIWDGFRAYVDTLRDFNIEAVEVPYKDGLEDGELKEKLEELAGKEQIDGIVSVGYSSAGIAPPIHRLAEAKIPVVLVGNDNGDMDRLCCVQTHYRILGEILGEILTRKLGEQEKVLLCTGNQSIPSHYLIVEGFDAYMKKNAIKNPVIRIGGNDSGLYEEICDRSSRDEMIRSCASVTARGSVFLGRAIVDCGRQGELLAVGSDVFPENVAYLEQGVFANLLHKNTYRQAYVATQYLTDYLLRNLAPPAKNIYIRSEVLFKSSIPMYQDERMAGPGIYIS